MTQLIASQAKLLNDLRKLGVAAGDTLFVHSSLRSVGPVDGGAATVVAALEQAVAPGTLAMPSFNLVPFDQRAATWNHATTPATTGYLTEYFRTLPGTVRSDHYSHSVAARGLQADWITQGHRSIEGMASPWDLAPWGKAYGSNSPFLRLYDADAKVLMLGVDYKSSTFMHLVEVTCWNRRQQQDLQAEYFYIDRERIGERWDALNWQDRDCVGAAPCRLFRVRQFVDTLTRWAQEEPARWFKGWKGW